MVSATHRITRRDWLVAFVGFTVGLLSFSALSVAERGCPDQEWGDPRNGD